MTQDDQQESVLYTGTPIHSGHVSVGVVVLDSLNPLTARVALLYSPPDFDNPWGFTDFETLVRETIKDDEPLEMAVARGIREELGASGRLLTYLMGTTVKLGPDRDNVEKTTLYHLVHCTDIDALTRRNDVEGRLTIVWRLLDEAIARQRQQESDMVKRLRPDLVEYAPLQKAREFLELKGVNKLGVTRPSGVV